MITPKFDLSTPLPRSVMRVAKPNETLVSLHGSPVLAVATTVKKKRGGKGKSETATENVHIPLGKGKTMVVPIQENGKGGEAPDLDDEDREKILKLRANLDSMLNMWG